MTLIIYDLQPKLTVYANGQKEDFCKCLIIGAIYEKVRIHERL